MGGFHKGLRRREKGAIRFKKLAHSLHTLNAGRLGRIFSISTDSEGERRPFQPVLSAVGKMASVLSAVEMVEKLPQRANQSSISKCGSSERRAGKVELR